MPELSEREWSLDGYVFGGTTPINVLSWELGDPTVSTHDQQLPLEDGAVFGRDTKGGQHITLDLLVNQPNRADARTAWRGLASRWSNDTARRTPGTIQVLKMRLLGSDTVRVYGRSRKFSPGDTGFLPGGALPITADFMMADHKFYSETERSLTLTLLSPQAVDSGTLNANATFEAGVDGWDTTGCNLTQSASGLGFEGDYAGVLTPDGVTSSVLITSDSFVASSDVRFRPTAQVSRSSGGPVPMKVGITFYDLDGTPIVTSYGNATDAASGSWTKAVHSALAPSGAVSARMHVAYSDSTPASGDVVLIDNARTNEVTGLAVPATIPFQLTGNSKKADSVTNAGDMETWPVITFEGPLTNPSVEYVGTGKKLRLTMAIAAGETVTIDTHPWKRTALRDGIYSVAGKLTGTRMAEMALPPGSTIVAFRGQDPTGTSRCRIFWRDASSTP